MTFGAAARQHAIYQNNGLICQRAMCQSMHGCEDVVECSKFPGYKQIVDFCGPVGTRSMHMDGALWRLQPSMSRQEARLTAEKTLGMYPLPTAYNTDGMY
jgi:hypothetical protein